MDVLSPLVQEKVNNGTLEMGIMRFRFLTTISTMNMDIHYLGNVPPKAAALRLENLNQVDE